MKTIKRNKKGFTFAILDFWSIVFFAVVVILLLIYVNFEKDRDEEVIISKIKGVNTPHYIMNILQSEKVNLSEYDSDCPITKNMTRIEILQYFGENADVIKNSGSLSHCLSPFLELVYIESDEKLFNKPIQDFGINSFYFDADIPNLSPTTDSSVYEFILGNNHPYPNRFSFISPTRNGNIKIEIGYKYEQDD